MTKADVTKRTFHFALLTRDDLRAATSSTVVVPLGSVEQHGPHLPVEVDFWLVSRVAERAVRACLPDVPILLTPTLPFGSAHHHLPFGGTISLSPNTYTDVLTDIGQGLVEQGFRKLVFLNGHGGNEALMRVAVDRLCYELRLEVRAAAVSYWDLIPDLADSLGLASWPIPGHAGHFETSLMLAARPKGVHLRRRHHDDPEQTNPLVAATEAAGYVRSFDAWLQSDGRSDDGQQASHELGSRILNELVARLADYLIRFHRAD